MNWNQIEGKWKQSMGKVKEKWGKLTDDDLTTINGKQGLSRPEWTRNVQKEECDGKIRKGCRQ